jgi:hypothetical protein
LIWASTTPVRKGVFDGATNARVEGRNAIALSLVKGAGIPVDDQHALMAQHRDLYEDDVHFNPEGADLQGDQAASMIRAVLRTDMQYQSRGGIGHERSWIYGSFDFTAAV